MLSDSFIRQVCFLHLPSWNRSRVEIKNNSNQQQAAPGKDRRSMSLHISYTKCFCRHGKHVLPSQGTAGFSYCNLFQGMNCCEHSGPTAPHFPSYVAVIQKVGDRITFYVITIHSPKKEYSNQ